MDEVLKALDEKEKQAEAASSPTFNGNQTFEDRTPISEDRTPIFEEKGFSSYGDRTEVKSPPPLPTQPPRLVSFCFLIDHSCITREIS